MKKIKFISIGIGILLSFFLSEFIARAYFFGGAVFSYSRINSFGILDNSGLIKYSNSNELKYELLPNLTTKYKLFDFQTNKEGFRDKNHELNEKTTKIAVLGDSFTMGTGVAKKNMYVKQTESLLNSETSKHIYEVFNFGVSGYALTNYLTILKKNALKHNPNLVVIGFCASNDHFEIGKDFSLDNFKIKPKKNVFWDSYLKKFLSIKLKLKKNKPITYELSHLNYMDKQFSILQDLLTKKNIKGLIFYLDLVYDPVRVNQIKFLAEKNELLFLDVSKFFKDKDLSSYIVNELDPHPNGKANQVFAKKLTSFILTNKKSIFTH